MNRFKTFLLLSYICIASVSAAIITPALPKIERYYNLSYGALEWIVSIFLLGYVVGQLIYGPIANRYGRLFALKLGLVINLVGIIICMFSVSFDSYLLLLFGRLISALGSAAGLSCTFILINELLDKDAQKSAMSYAIVSFTAGVGIAVTLGGIITTYIDWQFCFTALLIHGIIMLALVWCFEETLKEPIALSFSNIASKYIEVLKSHRLIVFSLGLGLVSSWTYCFAAAAPIYAHNILHLNASEYGYWNLLNMVGMLTSGFLGAYLINKIGPAKLLKLSLGLICIGLLSLIMIALLKFDSTILFFIVTTSLYLFTGLLFPGASYFASNAIADKANASSAMSFINMCSAMISVIIMGYLPFTSVLSLALIITGFYVLVLFLSLKIIPKGSMS